MPLILGMILLYLIVQVLTFRRVVGRGWRVAAVVPVPVMLAAVGGSVVGLVRQANLWPMPVFLGSMYMTAYLVVLRMAWNALGRRR